MKSRAINVALTVTAIVIALVVINYLASQHFGRIDLTERNLYTLSTATKGILEELPDVVTVKVYFSYDLPPALLALRRGVDDLLSEFKSVGGNKVQIEYIDPSINAVEEHRAIMLGIMPVQLNVIERDRRELVKVFMGIAIIHGDRMQVLPVIQNTANLEYRLAEAMIKVSTDEEVKLGWWGPDEKALDPVGGGFKGITRLLEQRYRLVEVNADNLDKVDVDNFTTMVLAAPGKLGKDGVYALEQYFRSGGRAIILVDRWKISENLKAAVRSTDVIEVLQKYGVEILPNMVLDRSNAMASFTGDVMTYHLPYPLWPQVRADNFSQEDPVTSDLNSLVLPWTSSIRVSEDVAAEDVVVLAKSTDAATAVGGESPSIDPEAAGKDMLKGKGGSVYSFAVRVNIDTPKGPAEMIVVGDSRFAQDNFLRPFPQNVAFIENAVDSLAMGDKLIGIRSRLDLYRPIAILSDGMYLLIRMFNVVIGPLVVFLIGVAVFLIRRWRRRIVRSTYGG